MQRRSGVQGLVFGGIMAGILLLCALIPFLGIFLPIPLVLVYVRYGGRTAVMTAVVSALLTAMFKGPIQAFLLTVPSGILPGLAFGYGFRHKLKPLVIGLLAVAVFFGGFAANYVVLRAAVLGGQDPLEHALKTPEGQQLMERNLKLMETLTTAQAPRNDSEKAFQEQQLALIAELRSNAMGVFWSILPMAILIGGVFTSWINYLLCRAVLPRFGHEVPRPAPFSEFRIPVWMVPLYILSGFGMTYLGNSIANAPWWLKILINVATPLAYVVALAGLAAAYGWLRIKQNMSKASAVLWCLAPIFFFRASVMMLYAMLAMWDAIFDFRGLGHGLWKRPDPEETL